MAVLTNTFEGGANGVTITTGNSGGASGDAFDDVVLGVGHTVVYANSPSLSQTMCGKITPGGTHDQSYLEWSTSLGTVGPTVYTRTYIHFVSALPGANNPRFLYLYSGASLRCGLKITGVTDPGKFSWSNAADASGPHSSTTLVADQTYRFESKFTLSATVGQVDINCYAGDSLTPIETLSSPADQNFGGGTADILRFPYWGSNANLPVVAYDGFGVSTTGYLGPVPVANAIFYVGV